MNAAGLALEAGGSRAGLEPDGGTGLADRPAGEVDGSRSVEAAAALPKLGVGTMVGYSLANFGANMVNAWSNTALPLFLGTYGLPNWLIGILANDRSFLGAFIQPLVGRLSDRTRTRFGRRRPFYLVGVPLTVISLLVLALHPPVWVVLVLVPVFGLFVAIASDPYFALMADITPSEQRGTMGGWMALANMLGQVALLALAAAFWETNELAVFLITIFGFAVCFAATFFLVPERPLAPVPATTPALTYDPVRYVRSILAHRELAKYVISQFFVWLGTGAAVPFLTRFAVETLGFTTGEAFQLVLIAVAMTSLCSLPAGWLGSRFGKKRVLMIGLIGFTLTALAASQVVTYPQAALGLAGIGTWNAVLVALGFPLLTDLMPRDRAGEFTSVGSVVWSLAVPIGSFVAGLFIDLTDGYRVVFVIAALCYGISAAILASVRPDRAQTTSG